MEGNQVLKETSQAKNNGDVDVPGAQSLDTRFTRKRAISADIDDAAKEPAVKQSKYSTRSNSAAESGSSAGRSNPPTQKSIDDLPPEVLEAVLQWISTPDLLKCRQVNRKFNEIASRIMRRRADVQLYFSAAANGHSKRIIKHEHCHDQNLLVNICKPFWTSSKSKNLKKLIAHLKVAKTFPITSFRFDCLDKFGNEEVQSFLSIWGENIVALTISIKDAASNVGVLHDLLTLPNLKKLEIHFDFNWREHRSNVELFVSSKEVTLPKLQAFCVNSCYRKYPRIVEAILKAAHNLKYFSIWRNERYATLRESVPDGIDTNDLDMMQTLTKLHCLKELRFLLSTELVEFLASKNIDLKLESLAVALRRQIRKNDQLKSAATILNHWFHSSKDTIQTLRIGPLGSLGSDLQIPKFENLQKLHLFGGRTIIESEVDIFPPLFEMADHFPNLKELSVTNLRNGAFVLPTSQQLKPMPRIEVLRIVGKLSTQCEETLLKATPNVTTLIIEEDDGWDFFWNDRSVSINFKLIADCLPKLKSFGWSIRRTTHRDLLCSLDAAITGLNVNFCHKIAKKFRNKESLSAAELALYQSEPRNPSILDLKELKRFDFMLSLYEIRKMDMYSNIFDSGRQGCCGYTIESYVIKNDDEAGFTLDDILYESGFTKVSKFLAFDLMPGLKIQTHKCYR